MRTYGKALVIVTLLAFSVAAVWASVTFTPPAAKQVRLGTAVLQPEKAAGKAKGTVSLVCGADLKKGALAIMASGLDPKQVYTVWLAKTEKPMPKGKTAAKTAAGKGTGQMTMAGMTMMGVGKAPYVLPVDSKGYARFTAPVTDCKSVAMQKLEIIEHPSKNAKDTKGILTVFTADLSQMLQGEMPKMKM